MRESFDFTQTSKSFDPVKYAEVVPLTKALLHRYINVKYYKKVKTTCGKNILFGLCQLVNIISRNGYSKAGFANFRMWQAVGPILSFGYQSQLCLLNCSCQGV